MMWVAKNCILLLHITHSVECDAWDTEKDTYRGRLPSTKAFLYVRTDAAIPPTSAK